MPEEQYKQQHKQQRRHFLPKSEREKIINTIGNFLKNYPELDFAYVHGSFLTPGHFGDIDIAVHLGNSLPNHGDKSVKDVKGIKVFNEVKYEINLEVALEELLRYPVDVRVLNQAPLSFQYSVLKNGRLVLERNENARVSFQTKTLSMYFDFAPLRRQYLREALDVEI